MKPSFAISTINPSVVIGPPAVLPSSPSKLNETLRPLFDLFSGKAKEIGGPIGTGSFVDVRDVAFMHVWAYENPSKSNGERYIACEGFGPLQAASDVLRRQYEGTAIASKIAVGKPGEGYIGYNKDTKLVEKVKYPPGKFRVDGGKAEVEMGFRYITFPQSVIDTAKVLERLL
jgi:nucleoside-diphosphate-sugar epimerase